MTKSQCVIPLGFGIWILGFGIFPAAHHSDAAFDPHHLVTLQGRVTAFAWQNPHIRIALEVGDAGRTTTWDIEGNPPGRIQGRGLKDALKAGDRVTLTAFRAKEPALFYARGRELTLPDGRRFVIGSPP